MGRMNVAVVMGGISTEHEISLMSGTNVCNAIPRERFNVKPVIIEKNGQWNVWSGWLSNREIFEKFPPNHAQLSPVDALSKLLKGNVDVVFLALHGPGGEDGVIQGFFETAGLPYTGSGVLGNAVGMDKILTKQILLQEGLATPKYIKEDSIEILENCMTFSDRVESELGFPCVPKISNQGSSKNVGIAKDRQQLESLLLEFARSGDEVLVEEFISGRELTCAVIDKPGERNSLALPPTELVPISSDWFDLHAKYTPGATDEITPARITPEETAEVQSIALKCHKVLHCGGMSRTDMMMKDGKFYVLEINTIPGLTATSLIPQAAAVEGISFPELLEIQLLWALEKRCKS